VWRIAYKWQSRIKTTSGSIVQSDLQEHQRTLRRRTHQIIRSVTENFEERLHLNTCISSLMELTNEIYAFDQAVESKGGFDQVDVQVASEAFHALVPMLAPFAPHISEELWASLGHRESLSRTSWPQFDDELAQEDEIEVAVQVNGKLRSRIFASANASDGELRQAALADTKVRAASEGREVVKVIVVPGKLVNIVLK
jgi:leucyl-tRNA synthetase